MDIYIYIGLGISIVLVLFFVLFIPLRKYKQKRYVSFHSDKIKKIEELNSKTEKIDISYSHHIDEVIVYKDEIGNYYPKEEFKKHLPEFESLCEVRQENLASYRQYKKAYFEIRNQESKKDSFFEKAKMNKKKFLEIEDKILDSLFMLDYDGEEIYFSICAKIIDTDDQSFKYTNKEYVFEKDYYITDDKEKIEEPQMINKEVVKEESIEEIQETKTNEFEDNGVLYSIISEDRVEIISLVDKEVSSLELGKVVYQEKEYILEKIPGDIFANNRHLLSLFVLDGVKEIDENAFRNCCNLEKVTLPETLKKISKKAFNGDGKIEYLFIPSSVDEIEDEAFALCTDLVYFSISGKTKYVGKSILWLVENVEFHIRDSYPKMWNDHFNIENTKIIYDFEEK